MKKVVLLALSFLLLFLLNSTRVYANSELKDELLDMRTENRKVYSLGNDIYRYEFYTNPIHYFDAYDNRYVEFDQGLAYNLKTAKYTTMNSNYRVELPTTSSVDNMVRVNYYDLYSIDIDYFGDKSMDESHISEENNVYATYQNNLDGQLRFIPQNSKLNATYLFTSPKSSRQVNFTIYSVDLSLKEIEDTYYFVDTANVAIFQTSDYYLLDSAGNVSFKVDVEVHDLGKGIYEFSLTVDDEFLDDENIVYPVSLIGGVTYSLVSQNDVIRDKTIVKDTYEGYDTDILTVAKQTYYPFQNTPVYLSEYHSYSILELNFDELTGSNITILDAKLYLNRYQSNVNSKLPLSEITSSDFDSIDGFSSYTKVLISQPTINSENIVYDITDEIENHVSNDETTLLLELSPQFILLGTSNLKYMNIISENADEYNSPYFTIDVTGINLNSSYGDSPAYEQINNLDLNCFGYALRMEHTILNISTPSGVINFTNIYVSNAYLYQVVIPAVIYTINNQTFYSTRVLSNINASISEDEYRIALRIGNVNETSTLFYTTPNNWGPFTKIDDFHFMIQLDDGSWSHKIGDLPSLHLSSVINPSEINWDAPYIDYFTGEYFPNHYNSYTIYFAVLHTKPDGWGY
ncbi:MAG: hypothetical protein A2102_03340 [Tenericutes bacterium GWF2_38_8]|nr:MAG: hypothetical protein A2Y43_03005 [Tenericutes bacterium GWA2_38_26]OHE43688.1 MAG: hypothetical protein A2102_03340 [Tenericutes bacterium GWF2_38_8]HBG32184.1 hypothetical protein [Acholeplasmataceae bacterium]HCB66766.1 hypothetical protein [Acholeplasmataceae bacterium]